MGRNHIGDLNVHCIGGGIGEANPVEKLLALVHLLSVNIDSNICRIEHFLFRFAVKGVVHNLVGCVDIHTVTDRCGVGNNHLGFVNLHAKGHGYAFVLRHIENPVDMGADVGSAVGSGAIHIGGVVWNGVHNIHCHILTGVIGVGDEVCQDIPCVDLCAVNLGFGIAGLVDLLLCDFLEGCIGKGHIRADRSGGFAENAGIHILHDCLQLSVANVADLNCKSVLGAVIDNIFSGVGSGVLHYHKEVSAGVIQGFCESKSAVCIGCSCQELCVIACDIEGVVSCIQLKGEGIVSQVAANQSLCTVEGKLRRLGSIGVLELDIFVGNAGLCAEHTVGIGHSDSHRYRVLNAGVGDTSNSTGHFFNGVGVGACRNIAKGAEGEAAVGLVGYGLQTGVTLVQLEGELAFFGSAAVENLAAVQNVLGGGSLVGIAEGYLVIHGILEVAACHQLTGSHIVGNLHHQVIDGGIVIHTVQYILAGCGIINRLGRNRFDDIVGILTGFCEQKLTLKLLFKFLVKGDEAYIAVDTVLTDQNRILGTIANIGNSTVLADIEGEGILFQNLSGQLLGDCVIQIDGGILRIIGIFKGNLALGSIRPIDSDGFLLIGRVYLNNGERSGQVAVIGNHLNGNAVLGLGIGPAGSILSDLGQNEVVGTCNGADGGEACFTGCIGIDAEAGCVVAGQGCPAAVGTDRLELEAGLGNGVVAGLVFHQLLHIQADRRCVVGITEGHFVRAVSDGGIVQIGNSSHQLTTVVGDSHGKGVEGSVIGHIGNITLDLHHLVSVGTHLSVGDASKDIFNRELLGAGLIYVIGGFGSLADDILPSSAVPLLNLVDEPATGVIAFRGEDLGAGNVQIHGNRAGGIGVDHNSRCAAVGGNHQSIVAVRLHTGMIPGAVRDCKVAVRIYLGNGHRSTGRQAENFNSLLCLDCELQISASVHGLFIGGGMGAVQHIVRLTGQGGTHIYIDGKFFIQNAVGNRMCALDFLGDIEIAVLIGGVGDNSGHKLGHGISRIQHLGQGGNSYGNRGSGIHLVVIAINFLANLAYSTGRNAADIHSLACLHIHSQHIAAVIGDNYLSGSIGNNRLCHNAGRQSHGQSIGIVRIADCLGHSLGQGDAGINFHRQSAVVAQPHDHIVAVVVAGCGMGIFGGVALHGGLGDIIVLVHRHIVQPTGAHRSHAQHRIDLSIGIALYIGIHGSSNLIHRNSFTVIEVNLGCCIVERHGFSQVTPVGVNQVVYFFCRICSIGLQRSRAPESYIGINLMVDTAFRIIIIGVILQISGIINICQLILRRIVNHTVKAVFPSNISTVCSCNGREYSLVRLVVIVSVQRRGLKANVCVTLKNHITLSRVHHAELIAVEGYSSGCIIDILISTNLGNINLAVGQKNLRIHAHGIENPQRRKEQLSNGGVSHIAHSFGNHLLQENGKDLLVDPNLQLLCPISLLRHSDLDISGGAPNLAGGRVATGAGIHSVGAISILNHTVGLAKQGDSLDFLDLHMLTDEVHIDQRGIVHAGAAVGGAAVGHGIERAGGEFIVDLIESIRQIRAGNIIICIYIIDICRYLGVGNSAVPIGIVVVKGPAAVAVAVIYSLAACPFQEIAIGILGSVVPAVEAVSGIRRVHQQTGGGAGCQVNAHTVYHMGSAVIFFHLGLVVGGIQQCA